MSERTSYEPGTPNWVELGVGPAHAWSPAGGVASNSASRASASAGSKSAARSAARCASACSLRRAAVLTVATFGLALQFFLLRAPRRSRPKGPASPEPAGSAGGAE